MPQKTPSHKTLCRCPCPSKSSTIWPKDTDVKTDSNTNISTNINTNTDININTDISTHTNTDINTTTTDINTNTITAINTNPDIITNTTTDMNTNNTTDVNTNTDIVIDIKKVTKLKLRTSKDTKVSENGQLKNIRVLYQQMAKDGTDTAGPKFAVCS